jgi:hypothetical protein
MRLRGGFLFFLVAGSACVACSSSSSSGASSSSSSSGGTGDGGPGSGDAATACTGACSAQTLAAAFGAAPLPFDRAFFGTQTLTTGLGIHVTAREGGTPDCPTDGSMPPQHALELTDIPAQIPVNGSASDANGVHADYNDESGGLGAIVKATAVTVTLTAIDSAKDPLWLALDVNATFPTGTVKGHVYAVYCASVSN